MPKGRTGSDAERAAHFEAFLAWLHDDLERAGDAYARLHRRLVQYFAGVRDAARYATDLADVTIDRAARKAHAEPELRQRDPASFVMGVAGYILLEYRRQPRAESLGFEPPDLRDWSDAEEMDRCLEQCLTRLTDENRRIVVEYYRNDSASTKASRRQAASGTGQSQLAYRVRVFRIRRQLLACIRECLGTRVTDRPFSSET